MLQEIKKHLKPMQKRSATSVFPIVGVGEGGAHKNLGNCNAQDIQRQIQAIVSSHQCLETPFNIAVAHQHQYCAACIVWEGMAVLAIHVSSQIK